MKKLLIFCILLFPIFGSEGPDFRPAAKKAIPAVVFITTETPQSPIYQDPQNLGDFFERILRQQRGQPQPPPVQRGLGSGFLVSSDGYILTNNHVIQGATKISVKLDDGRTFPGKLVGTDPTTDVAVVKIEASSLPYLTLADSSKLEIGEWVLAVGSPLGLQATATHGIVSATGRNNLHITDYEDFVQTDAAINRGNSGGPLLNLKGEVIGINTALISNSGGYMGLSFAIPSSMAQQVMEQLIEYGQVQQGYLGIVIEPINQNSAKLLGLNRVQGAIVADIEPNSPAEKGGLEPGDVILSINGKEIEDAITLRNAVKLSRPGTVIELNLFRKGEYHTKKVAIEDPPGIKIDHTTGHRLGVEVSEVTPELKSHLDLIAEDGVVVTRVKAHTPAYEGGIEPADLILSINQVEVNTPEEFYMILSKIPPKGRVLLWIKRGPILVVKSIRLPD